MSGDLQQGRRFADQGAGQAVVALGQVVAAQQVRVPVRGHGQQVRADALHAGRDGQGRAGGRGRGAEWVPPDVAGQPGVIKTGSGAENQPIYGLDAEPQPPARAGVAKAAAPC